MVKLIKYLDYPKNLQEFVCVLHIALFKYCLSFTPTLKVALGNIKNVFDLVFPY